MKAEPPPRQRSAAERRRPRSCLSPLGRRARRCPARTQQAQRRRHGRVCDESCPGRRAKAARRKTKPGSAHALACAQHAGSALA